MRRLPDISEREFAEFYLAHNSQGSNVYFIETAPRRTRFVAVARLFVLVAAAAGISGAVFYFLYRGALPSDSHAITLDAEGYERIISAQEALLRFDVPAALFDVHAAYDRFQSLRRAVAPPSLLARIAPFAAGEATENATDAVVRSFFDTGRALVSAADPLLLMTRAQLFSSSAPGDARAGAVFADYASRLRESSRTLAGFHATLTEAAARPDATPAMRDQVAAFLPRLSLIDEQVKELARRFDAFAWILGTDGPRRFLIVAQDPTRPRATGGSITAYGVLTTENGVITDVAFDDAYNFDGQLRANVIPPAPLKKITTAWSMHDANWFFDFPLSARKIASFYEAGSGHKPDGVIAVNEELFAKLLAIAQVTTTVNGITVRADNFLALLRQDPVARAAAITAMPVAVRSLPTLAQDTARRVMAIFSDAVRDKQIMVWTDDAAREVEIAARGWSGAVAQIADADFSAVVISDVGGGKTYAAREPISMRIAKQLEIATDGMMTATLVAELESRDAAPRLAYVRTYAPQGSVLLESSGSAYERAEDPIDYAAAQFTADETVVAVEGGARTDEASGVEVFEESGKTAFGSFVTLTPGRTTRLIYIYALPVRGTPFISVFHAQPSAKAHFFFAVTPPAGTAIIPDVASGFIGEYDGDGAHDLSFTVGYR